MAVTTEPATFENQAELLRTPATLETTRPVEALIVIYQCPASPPLAGP